MMLRLKNKIPGNASASFPIIPSSKTIRFHFPTELPAMTLYHARLVVLGRACLCII